MTGQLSWYRRMRGRLDMASCLQVGRTLQSYLDGDLDDLTAQRVTRHLELCRRCGMEAVTYTEIKASLARRGAAVDAAAVTRLRDFGEQLLEPGAASR